MPTYEYACEACGNEWEAEQRITENALKDCPKCSEPKARRLISGSRFLLKGGGWYADGYGNKSSSGSKPETGKPETGKPETGKPETKAETTKTETSPAAPAAPSAPSSSSSSE